MSSSGPTQQSAQNPPEAVFSPCGQYRYRFRRVWDPERPLVAFIGLNPTEIDPEKLNPTLRRCIAFAKAWDYGGIELVNLFARLAATPALLRQSPQPIGRDNDHWLIRSREEAALVVAAWGNDGDFMCRDRQVRTLIQPLHCLKINRSGQPAHPLYQRADRQPVPFR